MGDPCSIELHYRNEQQRALADLKLALEKHKVVFLNAPTGSGKSLINLTLARKQGSGYITTPLTTLVDQYEGSLRKEFCRLGYGSAVMGRKNYDCPYLNALDEISNSGLKLDIRIPRPKRRNKEEKFTAHLAPCTSDSPSFVGNVKSILELVKTPREADLSSDNKDEQHQLSTEQSTSCPFLSECPYYIAKNKAMKDTVAITTLPYFRHGVVNGIWRSENSDRLSSAMREMREEWDPEQSDETEPRLSWKRRSALIVDEAHNLPDSLVDFYTVKALSKWPRFYFKGFKEEVSEIAKLNPQNVNNETFSVFKKWFMGYMESEQTREKWIKQQIDMLGKFAGTPATIDREEGDYSPSDLKNLKKASYVPEDLPEELEKEREHLYKLSFMEQSLEADVEWIYTPENSDSESDLNQSLLIENKEDDNKERTLQWKPYEASPFLAPVWSLFSRIIFSSATFLDIPLFLKRLGLEDSEETVVPSTFPPENGPIFFVGNMRINYSFLKKERREKLEALVREIDTIANRHPDEKGVIHFSSYEWKRAIYNRLSPEVKDRVITHVPGDRREKLEEFLNSREPTIFLAVKMGEGVDFKDDKARWQIIPKCLYRDLKDPWVEAHKDRDKEWYELDALQSVIQAAGRIVRSKEDWGITYVLDTNVRRLINRYNAHCPEWFRGRIENHNRFNFS